MAVPKTDPANTLVIELKTGKVYIELLPKLAPKHVERVKTLAKQGFYDGIVFHRVIPGFMAQTGDPTGHRNGRLKLGDLPAEFTPTRSSAAPSGQRAPRIPTAPTASSSSALTHGCRS